LSIREARWLALEGQGLGTQRPAGRVDRRHLRGALAQIGTLQLDAINVVARTQFLVLFSRLWAYDVRRLHEMTGPEGDLFEYWGHAASLLPMAAHPLLRWRMERYRTAVAGGVYGEARRAWRSAEADYIAAVLEEVRDRGALAASELVDPRRRQGEWWDRRSDGRLALEWLFTTGELAAWRNPTFERVYDLPQRVIPADVLAQPTPCAADAQRALLLAASHSLGVATLGDLADYYRIKPAEARRGLAELVELGDLVRIEVEGWRQPGYCRPDARPRRPVRNHATVLSPFDSLIWERERTARLFGFDFRLEVYVPEAKRQFGYFVLPLLLGDELVGRLDVKADRKDSALRVHAAYLESGVEARRVAPFAADELGLLARWLGLGRVAVGSRGELAATLRRAV
jgi:hypothetical protein